MKSPIAFLIMGAILLSSRGIYASEVNEKDLKSRQEEIDRLEKNEADIEKFSLIDLQSLEKWKKEQSSKFFQERYDNVHRQNPMFFLTECVSKKCPFNRLSHAGYRKAFQHTVARALLSQITEEKPKNNCLSPAHYVTFGSGRLLTDFFILTEVFSKEPCANVTVHFIDPLYKAYKSYCKKIKAKKSPAIIELKFTDILEGNYNPKTQDDDIVKLNEILVRSLTFTQFIQCLKKNFPKATVTPLDYSNYPSYLRYMLESKELLQPVTLAAADIDTPAAGQTAHDVRNTVYAYARLCERVANINANSTNIWLRDDTRKKQISLVSLVPLLQPIPSPLCPEIFVNGTGKHLPDITLGVEEEILKADKK